MEYFYSEIFKLIYFFLKEDFFLFFLVKMEEIPIVISQEFIAHIEGLESPLTLLAGRTKEHGSKRIMECSDFFGAMLKELENHCRDSCIVERKAVKPNGELTMKTEFVVSIATPLDSSVEVFSADMKKSFVEIANRVVTNIKNEKKEHDNLCKYEIRTADYQVTYGKSPFQPEVVLSLAFEVYFYYH